MVRNFEKDSHEKTLVNFKPWLARRGIIVIAEPVDSEKNMYRVYCPKCRTWHVVYLSKYPEKRTFPWCLILQRYTLRLTKHERR